MIKMQQEANAKQLKLIFYEYQLEQLIKSYTRVAATTTESREQKRSNASIDHFAYSHSKYITEADVIKTGTVDGDSFDGDSFASQSRFDAYARLTTIWCMKFGKSMLGEVLKVRNKK